MKPAMNPRTEPGRVWDARWLVIYNRLFKNSLHGSMPSPSPETKTPTQIKTIFIWKRSHQSRHTPRNLHQMTEQASPALSQNGQEEAHDQPPETCRPARAATKNSTGGWQLQRLTSSHAIPLGRTRNRPTWLGTGGNSDEPLRVGLTGLTRTTQTTTKKHKKHRNSATPGTQQRLQPSESTHPSRENKPKRQRKRETPCKDPHERIGF